MLERRLNKKIWKAQPLRQKEDQEFRILETNCKRFRKRGWSTVIRSKSEKSRKQRLIIGFSKEEVIGVPLYIYIYIYIYIYLWSGENRNLFEVSLREQEKRNWINKYRQLWKFCIKREPGNRTETERGGEGKEMFFFF